MQNVSNDPESVAIDNLRTQIAHEESVSIIQAVFTADDEAKHRALAILQGREDPTADLSHPSSGELPLLMGMGESAKYLGVSRATLWRMIRAGRLTKVEIYHNAFRLRRSDILALVAGGRDPGSLSSDRCPPSSDTQGVSCG